MTTTYVPGYLGTATIDTQDMSAALGITSMSEDVNALRRGVLNQKTPRKGAGTRDVSFSATGILVAELAAALKALISQGIPIPVELQYGNPADGTDAGKDAGDFIFTNVTFGLDPDGDTTIDLSAESDGDVAYTPPTP